MAGHGCDGFDNALAGAHKQWRNQVIGRERRLAHHAAQRRRAAQTAWANVREAGHLANKHTRARVNQYHSTHIIQQVINLNGEWDFRLGEGSWRKIVVPGAWEMQTGDFQTEGPARYRRSFYLDAVSTRVTLECDAISFAATVSVNGMAVGSHTSLWSAFEIDVTHAVRTGDNELEIEVWKPGKRYPLRECLAGFLPDVANTFGGIWQGVRLHLGNRLGFDDVKIHAHADGTLYVSGRVRSAAFPDATHCRIEVLAYPSGPVCAIRDTEIYQSNFSETLQIANVTQWHPSEPAALYEVVLTVLDTSQQILAHTRRRIGFRNITAQQNTTLLNDVPLHVRGVLSWGWDAKRLCPTPSRDEIHPMFAQCRALGFNLVKLCLFVPDETLFDVADEMGLLLWLELPMWLPNVTPAFKELALREYEAILRRVHHHPSLVLISLGCELDNAADAPFLQQLGALARAWLPNALHCQNSGSAEAYGGAISKDDSDFYDYHFYAEPHFFEPLINHFSRAYWPNKPWIYGEFCDADTLRDFDALKSLDTWWLTQPLTMQRDELTWMQEFETRLAAAGIADGSQKIAALGRRQATAIRKFTLEQTRKRSATGGYVVTGWQDTPITTSGLVDDAGELKFDPRTFAQFNAELVLVLDRERRRQWTHGGDRPAQHDPFVVWQGQPFELHVSLSNGGSAVQDAKLSWQLDAVSGVVDGVSVGAGGLHELAVLPITLPVTSAIQQHTLAVTLHHAQGETHNEWTLWSVPKQMIDFSRVMYALDDVAIERAQQGERVLVWLREPDERFTKPMPFWREAIHLIPSEMPGILSEASADLRYFGVATDFAMDLVKLRQLFEVHDVRSLWRRFDARAMTWAEYVIEVKIGAGSLVISTLRFAGGLGAQPSYLETNPMGSWLLASLLA